MKRLTLLAAVALAALPVIRAATLTGTTGDLDVVLGGRLVSFAPEGANNLAIDGPFAGAPIGVSFAALLTTLDFASPEVVFTHGSYIIGLQLDPLTDSAGQVTPTAPGSFSSFFDVFFDATFLFLGPGSGDGSGDVLGEFGSLPGISNCVNGAVSTCEFRQTLMLTGSFDAASNTLSGVAVGAVVPEPAPLTLGGLGILLLALRRRK